MGVIWGSCSLGASRSSFFCVGAVVFVWMLILQKKKKKKKKKKRALVHVG